MSVGCFAVSAPWPPCVFSLSNDISLEYPGRDSLSNDMHESGALGVFCSPNFNWLVPSSIFLSVASWFSSLPPTSLWVLLKCPSSSGFASANSLEFDLFGLGVSCPIHSSCSNSYPSSTAILNWSVSSSGHVYV